MAEATDLTCRVPLALACVQKIVAQTSVRRRVWIQVARVARHPNGELGEVVLGGDGEENAQEIPDIYVRGARHSHRHSECSLTQAPEWGGRVLPRCWETVGGMVWVVLVVVWIVWVGLWIGSWIDSWIVSWIDSWIDSWIGS